jgi:aspartate racemase
MAKHIGIVACSAEGAALCYQTICKEGSALMGPHAHPEVSMHTHPLSEYMEYIYRNEWEGVARIMLSSSEKLRAAGADFMISPDNTIHQVFEDVQQQSPLPWLHIAEEVAREARRKGYTKSAILGTKYLMTGPVYPDAYAKYRLGYAIPDEKIREKIDRIIFNELVYGDIKPGSKNYFLDLIREFKKHGCDSVVLGCTEIPLIVLPGESSLPVLDSTRILARAALHFALSE